MFRRVTLLLLTNFAIMIVLSAVVELLVQIPAVEDALSDGEFDTEIIYFLVVAAIFGFGGSFISLAMSKSIAKWTTGAQVIVHPQDQGQAWLLNVVAAHARNAGIAMPEVAVYASDDVNAFATGMTRNSSLVAVSTGLLQAMPADEIEAVLGHEIAHVANGDMVTLTLVQGVLNTFVIFLSRAVGLVIDRAVLRQRRGFGLGYYLTVFVLQLVLGMLATMVVMAFSRWREYRADAGGARLAGPHKMVSALYRLQSIHQPAHLPAAMRAFGIRGGGVFALFRSHPPLEKRIARLSQPQPPAPHAPPGMPYPQQPPYAQQPQQPQAPYPRHPQQPPPPGYRGY
jgi:heat shock protein HtpX